MTEKIYALLGGGAYIIFIKTLDIYRKCGIIKNVENTLDRR